jgi:D-alanine-D-alanine ligase
MFLTSNKLAAKKLLREGGIPTPDWYTLEDVLPDHRSHRGLFIIKSVWEHASIGLGDDSIIGAMDARELQVELEKRKEQLGGEAFAEWYIDGREFNLSLLERKEGVSVLPPAEILFRDFPADKPRIVGYRAKWDEGAHEYHNTPRSFDFPAEDKGLLERLKTLSRSCWDLFGLRGYARVDFRVDRKGVPWILEINANPCLTPDSGFVAAVEESGLDYTGLIAEIVAGAFRP